MANQPWDINQKCNVGPCSAFSTSPSQLQEVTLDPETNGIVSMSQIQTAFTNSMGESVSSNSMKQYEEQLGILRKENFHLKLRVYFLEERLGNGTPIPMQDILEDNVKLQIELEELRRQLSEKQELLTAAAKAMDTLADKNTLSIKDSCDSDDSLKFNVQQLDNRLAKNELITLKKISLTHMNDDKLVSSESAVPLEFTEDEKEELSKLKRDHLTACQMIRECMLRIKKLEKELKDKDSKLEELLDKLASTGSSQINELVDKIKVKDDHIFELERKLVNSGTVANSIVKDSHEFIGTENNSLQELLVKRLQGLAYFLDSLLSHKCVIGQDKCKMARNLLEQSLAFLDETMVGDLTVDESNLEISNLLKIEDLSLLFGHHQLEERTGSHRLNVTWPENAPSESDCWSEPDRSVSLARMGLSATLNHSNAVASDDSRYRNRRNRVTMSSRVDHSDSDKELLLVEIGNLTREKLSLQDDYDKLRDEQSQLVAKFNMLQNNLKATSDEKDLQTENVTSLQSKLLKLQNVLEHKSEELILSKSEYDQLEASCKNELENISKLKIEMRETEEKYKVRLHSAEKQFIELKEIERTLRRQVDEATLQASQAALDRTRNAHEKLHAERNMEQLKIQLENSEKLRREAELKVAALDVQLSELAGEQEILQQQLQLVHVVISDDDRPTSPDLGIDSDRLSSLENVNVDIHQLSKIQLLRENRELKEKLDRSKEALAEAVAHLNQANSRKHTVQRAICRQIHKTQNVLRQARTNFQPTQHLLKSDQ